MAGQFNTGIFLFLMFVSSCSSFNLEVKSPKVFAGSKGEYFGFSVALHRANNTYWAIVGATMSNSTGTLTQLKNGAVYRCPLSGGSTCVNMAIDDAAPRSDQVKIGQQMGANVVSLGHNKGIMACAPRYQDIGNFLQIHGRCGLVNGKSFKSRTLFWNPCNSGTNLGAYGLQYCLAGFSADASPYGTLLTGMPGSQRSQGRIAIQNEKNIWDESGLNLKWMTIGDRTVVDDMMGYSVVWGMFSPSATIGNIVGGAPTGSNRRGKVIFYEMDGMLPIHAVIENTDDTMGIGSYFGAVLCAVDLTNDKISDLIVGAPLHTVVKDEGKAYIYLTDKNGAFSLKGTVNGEGTPGARFGSSMASAGDINGDGYNDVIIGAPYGGPDGNGAIYVYHGSLNGFGNSFRPVQKIYAATLPGTPLSFGSSLSGGLDFDENGFPDIVVGSFLSDKAYAFKTKPILKVSGELTVNTTRISLSPLSSSTCRTEGSKKYQCLQLQFCATFSGTAVPNTIDLSVKFEFDRDQLAGKRALLIEGSKLLFTKQLTLSLVNDTQKCERLVLYVQENVNNILSPISIVASYEYKEPVAGCGSKPCPIIDMYQSKSLSTQATYMRDCGSDDVCNADLVVTASPELPGGGTELVFGKVNTFSIKIKVLNKGESAFLSKMNIIFPSDFTAAGVDFVNEPNPLWERKNEKDGKRRIDFNLDSPFVVNQTLDIVVKFAVAKDRPSAKSLSLVIKATSVSNELVPADNTATVSVTTALQADLTASGSASPDKFFYEKVQLAKTPDLKNESQVGPVVEYSFLIQNQGPSPVQGMYSRISLVTKHNDKWLLMLFSATVEGSVSCSLGNKTNPLNLMPANGKNVKSRRRRDAKVKSPNSVEKLNCRTATCVTFDCYLGVLKQGESRTLKLRTRLFQNTFIEEDRGPTQLDAKISIVIPREEQEFLRQPVNDKPDEAVVSIHVSPPVSFKEGKKEPVAWWIIFLAILGALLLIVAVIIALWKVGFFKRKLKGKKISGPTDNDDELID